jgi:hypothetical protein
MQFFPAAGGENSIFLQFMGINHQELITFLLHKFTLKCENCGGKKTFRDILPKIGTYTVRVVILTDVDRIPQKRQIFGTLYRLLLNGL